MAKTALVLSGGAARGAYELGVWQALRQLQIPINIVTGTSIGAVNGAMIAQKEFETAQQLWNNLEINEHFKLENSDINTLPDKIRYSLTTVSKLIIKENNGRDVRLLLESLEQVLDEEKIRSSDIEFGLVTVNLDKKISCECFIEDIPRGKLLDYIYASCSVSPVFKPYVIDGERYVDGCYHDNLPVSMALKKGAERIIAVNLEAFGVVNKQVLSTTPNLTLIRCHWDLGPTLYFGPERIRLNTKLGYLDTLKAFKVYDGQAYAFEPGSADVLWKKMIKEKDLLPFWNAAQRNSRHSFFLKNRRASKALFLHLRKRLINKLDIAHMFLAWAENAGEIFDLDPCSIYSLDSFNQELLAQYAKTCDLDLPDLPDLPGIDEITQVLGDTGITGFGALRIKLSIFKDSVKDLLQKQIPEKINKRTTAKYLVSVLREQIKNTDTTAVSNLAALMPNEFLAALYILWLLDFAE